MLDKGKFPHKSDYDLDKFYFMMQVEMSVIGDINKIVQTSLLSVRNMLALHLKHYNSKYNDWAV
jgi:hypothetical protein